MAIIVEVTGSGPHLDRARELFLEYGQTLGASQCLKDFDREVASLPGAYTPPGGCLLVAELGIIAGGCVALRRLDDMRCEMKRLYVRPVFRGAGLASLLVERAIERARAMGYREILLDTLPQMRRARELYETFGFRPCAPYLPEPTPGADCYALDLTRPA